MKRLISCLKNPFSSYLRAFSFLFTIFLVSFLAVTLLADIIGGGFIHYNTDDIVQYYPMMAGFIEKLKLGKFDIYDTSFFAGASSFSGSYYIPLDIFTFLTFIFSYTIQTEIAYALVNTLKPLLGGALLFYLLKRQDFRPKMCFFTSLLYTFGGLYATYCVFPVYMSLIFYIPLTVLVADLFRTNKYAFSLVTLYTVVIIFYDFYIAYMLLAFFMIYMLMSGFINNDYSLFSKNSFIINKKFYYQIFLSFLLILLGLGISMCIFLPNLMYITENTFRNHYDEILLHYNLKHYLIFYSTYFLTSNPVRILIYHGDYIRNHASMFMTIFSLIFLVELFFLKGKKFNRLKCFVIFFNLLINIPLMSMIMTGTSQSYIRWFFIVYFINIYSAMIVADKYDFNLGANTRTKIISAIVLIIALLFVFYTYFISEEYKLYEGSDYFYPIITIFFVTVGLYAITLLFKKLNKLSVFVFMAEIIASAVVIFTNTGNNSSYYLHSRKLLDYTYNNLEKFTSFDENSAYRVALNASETTYLTNTSFLYQNLNSANFFHSFYDSAFNEHISFYLEEDSSNWSKRLQILYQAPFCYTYGVKYHIVPNGMKMPEIYHKQPESVEGKDSDTNFDYYEIESMKPFIVYDSFIEDASYLNPIQSSMVNALFGSFASDLDSDMFKQFVKENHLNTIDYDKAYDIAYNGNTITFFGKLEKLDGTYYNVLDLSKSEDNFKNVDMAVFIVNSAYYRDKAFDHSFIIDTNGVKHQLYFGQLALDDTFTPEKAYFKTELYPYGITLLTWNSTLFDDTYQAYQNFYTNEEFSIIDDMMNIKFNMEASDYGRIIKTNFTYSPDWIVDNNKYKTVNILGGYLGIIVPPNTSKVDISLKFEPKGLNLGLTISSVCLTGFTSLTCAIYVSNSFKYKEYEITD